MTTRVLGVRASTLLSLPPGRHDEFAEVRWMSVLRSLSALQMYQRATTGPIDGPASCGSCCSTTGSRGRSPGA